MELIGTIVDAVHQPVAVVIVELFVAEAGIGLLPEPQTVVTSVIGKIAIQFLINVIY